jgi:alkylation response protein AidB-like acyl-CoA dehydrogenase
VPREFGGSDVSSAQLLAGYEQLAQACLTTCFILTQRNAAIQRIATCEAEGLKAQLLPDLAGGRIFATVGISHLSTSRQHLAQPAVAAELSETSLRLSGSVPWVTGAAHADYIVTGGTCPDGRQVLAAVPTKVQGAVVGPSAQLMALSASATASLELHNVEIPRDHLLAGPVTGVMQQGGGGAGSLTTSMLALGLARRAALLIRKESARRGELCGIAGQFDDELARLRGDFDLAIAGAAPADGALTASAIRHRANSLSLRITQAALAISKGAGFVIGHPAELAVREAMFFLVWSCPQPVVQGVLEELACREGLG